jgi:SAM-dependent methyltransferase
MTPDYSLRAPWYAIEYREEQDLDFLAGLVSPRVGSVLEIPCGAGRATRRLASTGREIVAADLEPAMLDANAALFPGGRPPANLTLVQADMRAVDLGRRFDLILVPREAIQLLAEDGEVAAALAALARHLAPSARLMLDLAPLGLVSPPAERDLHLGPGYLDPSAPPGAWIDEWTRDAGPARLSRRRRQAAPERDRIRIDFEYEAEDPDHGMRRWSSSMIMRDHSPAAIADLAAAAGLRPAEILGAYDGRPYRPGDPRLVAILEAADGR